MMSKELLNNPADAVSEMIDGIILTHPRLSKMNGYNVIIRSDFNEEVKAGGKVAIISGGGSGHEPSHAGWVGEGMLTAAVCGNIFASPSVDSILATIRTVTGHAGCLLIVKNYTGDRLNFGLAAEAAKSEGFHVDMVIVADDCALLDSDSIAGARGIAGTCLVHKVAGAAAARGETLSSVKSIVEHLVIGSMGVALSTCTVPGQEPSDRLVPGDGKMELGLGIHGEPGVQVCPIEEVDVVVPALLKPVLESAELKSALEIHSSIVVLVNNLGGATPMEAYITAQSVFTHVTQKGFIVSRLYTGTFMTSLDMRGISISILVVSNDKLVALLDAPTLAPAWPNDSRAFVENVGIKHKVVEPLEVDVLPDTEQTIGDESEIRSKIYEILNTVCVAVEEEKETLCALDKQCGDGDCGETFFAMANDVRSNVLKGNIPTNSVKAFLRSIGCCLRRMGGTSGALLAIFCFACETSFSQEDTRSVSFNTVQVEHWKAAVGAGVAAMSQYGGASRGMRTMLDPLIELYDALGVPPNDLKVVAARVEQVAQSTSEMVAVAGRGSYIPVEHYKGSPDPGAVAIATIVQGLVTALH